jgi:hypothetical protein
MGWNGFWQDSNVFFALLIHCLWNICCFHDSNIRGKLIIPLPAPWGGRAGQGSTEATCCWVSGGLESPTKPFNHHCYG